MREGGKRGRGDKRVLRGGKGLRNCINTVENVLESKFNMQLWAAVYSYALLLLFFFPMPRPLSDNSYGFQ